MAACGLVVVPNQAQYFNHEMHQGFRAPNLILTRVARDWCICASAQTLVGPQRFISGSVVLSPNRRFTSPSKQTADSQNFWRMSNTDAPAWVYVHRRAISPHFAGAWAKEERSFWTDWQRLASFRTFSRLISDLHLICRIIPTDLWSKPRVRFAWLGRWWTMVDSTFLTKCTL